MNPSVTALRDKIASLEPGTVSKPTLVYFDIIGIGWPIHCLLHLKDVDYDLTRITIQDWMYRDDAGEQALKRAFPNGHVPLYVDTEISISQSIPIMLYLAEQHGLAGADMHQRYQVMEVMGHAYDALFHFSGLLQIIIRTGMDDEVVEARKNAYMGRGQWGVVSGGFDNNLIGFQNYLRRNPAGSGFFVGSDLSIADLHAFNVLCNWYKAFDRERFSAYTELDQFIQRIAKIPGVTDYIERKQEATPWFQLPQIAISLTSAEYLQGLLD